MIRIALLFSICFGTLAILLAVSGTSGLDVVRSFFEGISGYSLERAEFVGYGPASEILRRMAPLVVTGLAVFMALQVGLFNIGAEGQLKVGGLAAVFVALFFGVDGVVGILLAVTAGIVAGMMWAIPAGAIKVWRGGHEVITTIMLNNVAAHLASYLIAGPLKKPGSSEAASDFVSDSLRLYPIGDAGRTITLQPALIVGVLLCIVAAWWLVRTPNGFEMRASGANPIASLFAGISVRRFAFWGMAVSGGIAGLAGGMHLLGQEGRFAEGFSPGFGFDSLGVALLAGRSPLGIIPAALLFAAIDQGSLRTQVATGLPKEISAVIQGLIILMVAVMRYRRSFVS
jgi:simple sugar transport system permease protein